MRLRVLLLALFAALWIPSVSQAVPDTLSVRVTDVTPDSFCLVWLSNISADPSVEVYSDQSMSNNVTSKAKLVLMTGQDYIFKVRVQGLEPGTGYYARAVTTDKADPDSRSFSALQAVTTQMEAASYFYQDGIPHVLANDLLAFPVYTPAGTSEAKPGLGDLILLETSGSSYPISAFVGEGADAPDGVLDLNNVFGQEGRNIMVNGGDQAVLTVYRGGTLSSLVHYRWLQENSGVTEVNEPLKGFFADFNLDGKIDMADFLEFKAHYRTEMSGDAYNPDYDYVEDSEGVVDAREFSRFAEQYGLTDVPKQ